MEDLYGLVIVNGPYSRDDSSIHWYTNDYGETKTEFRKSLKRTGISIAERSYDVYCKEDIKVKVFTSKDAFLKECDKLNFKPNIEEV